jgi:hypothetical protein
LDPELDVMQACRRHRDNSVRRPVRSVQRRFPRFVFVVVVVGRLCERSELDDLVPHFGIREDARGIAAASAEGDVSER